MLMIRVMKVALSMLINLLMELMIVLIDFQEGEVENIDTLNLILPRPLLQTAIPNW